MRLRNLAVIAIMAAGLTGLAAAQDAPPPGTSQNGPRGGHGMGQDFHGVGGQVTAIDGSTITLQSFRGETAKVQITSSTRFTNDRSEAKLSDFKVGDRVFVSGGQGKDGVWTAQVLGKRTGQGPQRGGAMAQLKPEDNGKTYILGEVTKIDGVKLTVKKPDGTVQVIEADDDTSFRNERRENVTLADVKVGDFVRGQGEVMNGVFVPRQLNAGARRPRQSPDAEAPPEFAPTQQGAEPQGQTAPASSSDKK